MKEQERKERSERMRRYWHFETDQTMRAHIHEYVEKRQDAALNHKDADWLFFFGAHKAVQRLLHIDRERVQQLAMPKAIRKYHLPQTGFDTCFACMGSGYHPQKRGTGITFKRLDMLGARLKKRVAKVKDKPACPLCGSELYYSIYIGTENISVSCDSCHAHYGGRGFRTLKEAMTYMRYPARSARRGQRPMTLKEIEKERAKKRR